MLPQHWNGLCGTLQQKQTTFNDLVAEAWNGELGFKSVWDDCIIKANVTNDITAK